MSSVEHAGAACNRIVSIHEVVRTARVLGTNKDDGHREVRILHPRITGRTGHGPLSGIIRQPEEIDALVSSIHEASEQDFYVLLNPVDPAVLHARGSDCSFRSIRQGEGVSDASILRREWLLVDFDPCRATGTNSTEQEKAAALRLASFIRDELQARGWPKPILANSGNGYHLLYPLDLENSTEATELVAGVLQTLARRWGATDQEAQAAKEGRATGHPVTIDTTVSNAARLTRCYGTWNCKGEDTPERPRRLSGLVDVPDRTRPVSVDQLRALIRELGSSPVQPTATPVGVRKGSARGGPPIKLRESLEAMGLEFRRKDTAGGPKGEAWDELYELKVCPFDPAHDRWESVVGRRKTAEGSRLAFRCPHQGCSGRHWQDLRQLIADAGALILDGARLDVLALPPEVTDVGLVVDRGKIAPSLGNLVLILRNDPAAPVFYLDEFTHKIMRISGPDSRALRDQDASEVRCWAEARYQARFGKDDAFSAIEMVAAERARNPLQEWLRGLRWDRRPRLRDWICNAVDCERTEINMAMAKKFLIGAVARALHPGCKMENMLMLVGSQGVGKDQLLSALFGERWLDSTPIGIENKDFYLHLAGCWCHNFSELSTLKRADIELMKQILSLQKDSFRPPYGRNEVTLPRHCVMVGTSNRYDFLRDETGSRRFWPIAVGNWIDWRWIEDERDQLWAEAVAEFDAGAEWWLSPDEEARHAEAVEAFENEDILAQPVLQFVERRSTASLQEVVRHLNRDDDCRGERSKEHRIAAILTRAGWRRERPRVGRRRTTIWHNPALEAQEGEV